MGLVCTSSPADKGAANKWLCLDGLDRVQDCAKLSQLTGFPPTGGLLLEMEFALLLLAGIREAEPCLRFQAAWGDNPCLSSCAEPADGCDDVFP